MSPAPENRWIQTLSLTAPHLADNTADADRLVNALKTALKTDDIRIDLQLLKKIPARLRAWSYNVKCVFFKHNTHYELLDILDPEAYQSTLGLAVDLGTTRVVTRLINLESGQTVAELAFDNPQIQIGPDVLTRIHYAEKEGGLDHLNSMIIEALNQTILDLCETHQVEPEALYLITVAGNTAMTHLFLGLSPQWIIREPYIPVVNRPGLIRARELGIEAHPEARLYMFPNVGSYFGGDLIAGILYSGLNRQEETSILVDVGTNAEVVFGNQNWLIACAGAAGPALEGGVTKMGMMAGPGVIDRIVVDPVDHHLQIHTIAGQPPVGICGSGLIDLAAQLFLAGVVNIQGKLTGSHPRIKEIDGIRHLVVVPASDSATGEDLTLSQVDLDSLIRSKAAMYTILNTIVTYVGMTFDDIATFYVAGTFGSFIDPDSAITIGMLPDLDRGKYQVLGNSSLGGATLLLTDATSADALDAIRDQITYLELNVNQEFMNRFSAAKFLPHTDPARFPSVKVWE